VSSGRLVHTAACMYSGVWKGGEGQKSIEIQFEVVAVYLVVHTGASWRIRLNVQLY